MVTGPTVLTDSLSFSKPSFFKINVRLALPSKLCKQKFNLFDGARRIEITLSKIDIQKNSAQCRGDYIRQDGYTAEEMKEGKVFPFTINYIKRENVYAVESLEIKALRGRTKFTRR